MRSFARTLIVLLMFAALPLRGYAALAMDLCEMQHRSAAPPQHAAQVHDADRGNGPQGFGDQEGRPAASNCSMCAGCCVGVSFAPDTVQPVTILALAPERIPFVGTQASGHVPGGLDRPPLVF